MEKIISTRDFAAIKKMAQIVNPLVSKKATILKKVASLMEEIEGPAGLNVQINGMEAGIRAKYGVGTEDLIKKVVAPAMHTDGTPALDAKTGKQLTKTTWEPTDLLKYDAEHNRYILTTPDSEGTQEVPEAPEAGSDFDEDEERLNAEAEAQDAFAQQAAEEEANKSDNPFDL